MELKRCSRNTFYRASGTFNRTNYGIETFLNFDTVGLGNLLLIAPIMELKRINGNIRSFIEALLIAPIMELKPIF